MHAALQLFLVRSLTLKVPGGLKTQQALTAWPDSLLHCPFKGGYFSSVDLEMGVHVLLREVSAYGRLEM